MEATNAKPVSDWGNTFYDGASGVGKFKADLGMIIGVIISAVFMIIGIYMTIHDDDADYLRIRGKILQSECVKSSTLYDDKGRPINNYKCNIMVTYMIDGQVYSSKMYMSGTSSYIKDEPVDLMVLKTDYTNVQFAYIDKSTMGYIMMLLSFGIIGIAYLNYYLTHNYKIFSVTQGFSTLFGLFR
jgi:hypothetical protein